MGRGPLAVATGVLGPLASSNPFYRLESGYWWYAGGCLLVGLAALVAPPRVLVQHRCVLSASEPA